MWPCDPTAFRTSRAAVSAEPEVAQQPPQRRLQTRSAPWKDMKALEFPLVQPAVPSRCMVGTGTAGAGPQRAKPAKKEKVQGGCRRADWQPTVELRKGRRELDVVHQEQTSLEHRQQVHQSSRAPRARGALLCRRCAQMIPRRHGATDQKSDARRWNRMGQKAFQHMLGTFITSDQTTRAQDQRVGRDGGGARPVKKRHRGERCAWCRLLSVVGHDL